MAEWSKALVSATGHLDGMGSNPTSVMPHCYKLRLFIGQKQFENNKKDTFNCIDYIGRISEWSKVLVSSTSHFDGVGLNNTPVMPHCYKLKLQLHDAIYRLRFYSKSLIHILLLSNLYNNVASIQ